MTSLLGRFSSLGLFVLFVLGLVLDVRLIEPANQVIPFLCHQRLIFENFICVELPMLLLK